MAKLAGINDQPEGLVKGLMVNGGAPELTEAERAQALGALRRHPEIDDWLEFTPGRRVLVRSGKVWIWVRQFLITNPPRRVLSCWVKSKDFLSWHKLRRCRIHKTR